MAQSKSRKEPRYRSQPATAKAAVLSANRSRRENEPQTLHAQLYGAIKERRSLVRRGDLEIAVPCFRSAATRHPFAANAKDPPVVFQLPL